MVPLGELVDFYSGGTPSKSRPEFWSGDVPWFSAKDMKQPRLNNSADHLSDEVFNVTSLRKLPAGTIAMVVRGMILAHTVPISILDVDAAINQDLKALLPKENVDTSFLAAMLRAQHVTILSRVSTAAHGTKKLDSRVLEELLVPNPPLDEQRRIAAILDQADAIRAKRRQVRAHLDSLTQSIFHDMFGRTGSPNARLVDIAAVSSGITKGRRTTAPTSPVPYLAVSNVQAGHLKLDIVKTIDATDGEISRYSLAPGDLVLTEGGDPDKLGRGAVWRGELATCLHQNHVFRVRVGSDEGVLPDYLAAFMAGRAARLYFMRAAKQTTGIASINMTQLKALPLHVPPVARQEEYVRRLRAIEKERRAVDQAYAAGDELFASLQARAFRGEL